MKVICAEVECREMQDKGIAALRRQLVTKEILEWFALEGTSKVTSGQAPARSRDTFHQSRCFVFEQPKCQIPSPPARTWCEPLLWQQLGWDSGLAGSRFLPGAVTKDQG